jgi:phosphatidylinositol-3,4,5-trisphosphate 3-phosphatase/dual-specificity protein phosphatase PTEN
VARRVREREGDKPLAIFDSTESPDRDGWVMVGQGQTIASVKVSEPSDNLAASAAQPEELNAMLNFQAAYDTVSRSMSSSTTTIFRLSSPPSEDIRISSTPTYDPIDIGDEGEPDRSGQQDRKDGRVDEVRYSNCIRVSYEAHQYR